MSALLLAHPVIHRRPARILARCAAAALILAALAVSRFDPIGRARPRLCAGPCGSLAPLSRGVA